jgi:hypothetical protein
MQKVDYINVKCSTEGRKKVFAKLKKMAADKGVVMTDLIMLQLDDATKEYDSWYQNRKELANESLEGNE